MLRSLIALLLLLPGCLQVSAQHLEITDTAPLDYRLKVKQIDEFMQRFNQEVIPDYFLQVNSTQRTAIAMLALFDYQLLKTKRSEAEEMVKAIFERHIRLSFTDTTWTAVAHCNALYKGKAQPLTLRLKPERVKDQIYKWVIVDAEADFLQLKPQRQNPGLAISPVENEVNFIALNAITHNEVVNILNYKSASRPTDSLTAFFALVYSGQLQIENVQELEYAFVVAPLYSFTVRKFRREALNSGWLIADFHKL